MISANQHSPTLEKYQYDVKVLENMPAGTLVTQVVATDTDIGTYGQVTYSIPSQVLLESFTINNVTGKDNNVIKERYGEHYFLFNKVC